jgi:hypothetical protein
LIDAVRSAYTALRTQPPIGPQLAVLALASVAGAYAGIDELGRQHMLLEIPAGSSLPQEISALTIGPRILVIGGIESTFLDVTCLSEGLAEVFDHFVAAVLERRATTGENPAVAVATVLERWREFLVTGTRSPGLKKLSALFGELLVVLDVVNSAGRADIGIWVGPFGGRHDFRGGATAIEVKTTLSHTSHHVTIHGEDQLVAPEHGQLFLHFVRLEQVPGGGRSVSSLVDELLTFGVAAEALFDRLKAAGLPVAQLAATSEIGFDVREQFTVPVDDHIPKVVPSSFALGHRPQGVVDISYVIDLDCCIDSALGDSAYQELVITIAEQGAT